MLQAADESPMNLEFPANASLPAGLIEAEVCG
jgi:hypothetical protein